MIKNSRKAYNRENKAKLRNDPWLLLDGNKFLISLYFLNYLFKVYLFLIVVLGIFKDPC